MNVSDISRRLQILGDRERAQVLQRCFKTASGQYGAGDLFVGLRVPEIRNPAKEYRALPCPEVITLRQRYLHEEIADNNMKTASRAHAEGRG